jgi:oxygen-independent coproporphyrinogen III oxidase
MRTKGLYIHIPFCDAICAYCDFVKMVRSDKTKQRYMDKLTTDLTTIDFTDVDTIYIGGGTPSSISLEILIPFLQRLPKVKEVTFEANPDHITDALLDALETTPVNRISLGVQTFDDAILQELGRTHSAEVARHAISLIKKRPFRLSIDLIYNLPGQTLDGVKRDFNEIQEVDHISWYSLILEPNTLHYTKYLKGTYQPNDQDDEMMAWIMQHMKQAGFTQYEISNYTKGEISYHNMHYWQADDVAAIGLGATGTTSEMRYRNTKDIERYIESNAPIRYEEARNLPEELVLVGLRTAQGIDLDEYQARTNESFQARYNIDKLVDEGYLTQEGTRIKPTAKGMMLNTNVLLELL